MLEFYSSNVDLLVFLCLPFVHSGDQILSATVYFDNVTYEDALQILEHAQPYKMELLLKRKPIKISTLESEPALEFTQVTITMLFFWICRVVLCLWLFFS